MSSKPTSLEKLAATKASADGKKADRDNYALYVRDCVEHRGWTPAHVAEYRAEVARIMKSGTEDERLAAREFWAYEADWIRSL